MDVEEGQPLRVLIVGGGVAAIEAALALRELAGERVAMTMLAPEREFVYRPMRVREPFAFPAARHYRLQDIAQDVGAELRQDAFRLLDSERRLVHTTGGQTLGYDALLLALGATQRPRFRHALTLHDRRLDEQLHSLIRDVEEGYVRKLAFIAPAPMPWPLPIYELALMTARRAWEMNERVSITLLTPEDAPLAIFGTAVSDAVSALLAEQGILMIPSAHCETPEPGEVSIHPGSRSLRVDHVVALPELFGPSTPGVPKRTAQGFIPVDAHCRVQGLDRVYAAGDATEFPIKHGGVAAQQADTAAAAIAALAGAPVEAKPFRPVIRAILFGAEQPLYLSARITSGRPTHSQISATPLWSPPTKIAAKYLAPYLESLDRSAVR